MPNPIFGVVAAARLDITVGSSSRAAYFALVAQYQFGTPVIYGRSPSELAATIGVPFYSSIVDPGIPATVPGVVVITFPNATPFVIVSGVTYPVSSAVGGGTLVGVNYVDPNGVLHPDVDWQWQISVEGYRNIATGGGWSQQLITYTGDGTAGRLIPTTFPLNSGVVAVWVFPQTTDIPAFRHNAMSGTVMTSSPIVTAGGIMSFLATGFTVTNSAPDSTLVNVIGRNYTALVLRDNTADARYMRVGSYGGISAIVGGTGAFVTGSPSAIGPFTHASDVLRTFTSNMGGGFNGTVATVDGLGGFGFNPPATGTGNFSIDSPATGRVFQLGINATMMWIFGRSSQMAMAQDLMPAGNSVSVGVEAKSLVNQITSLASSFSVGTDNNVNNSALQYYWVAFAIPVGDPVRTMFQPFKMTGVGGAGQVVPLPGLTPGFAIARQFVSTVPESQFRTPFNAGTTSVGFNQIGSANNEITAFGVGSLTLGSVMAPAATDVYGFAVQQGSGSFTPAVYVPAAIGTPAPSPYATDGGIIVAPAGSSAGQACKLGTTITPSV